MGSTPSSASVTFLFNSRCRWYSCLNSGSALISASISVCGCPSNIALPPSAEIRTPRPLRARGVGLGAEHRAAVTGAFPKITRAGLLAGSGFLWVVGRRHRLDPPVSQATEVAWVYDPTLCNRARQASSQVLDWLGE